MKKILVALFLALILFYLSTKNSLAACTACTIGHSGLNPICSVWQQCVANRSSYNCDTKSDCTNLQNGRIGGGGGSLPVMNPTCGSGGIGTEIDTALGCIPFQDTDSFVGKIFKWGLGIGGGIAFLLILYGGFMVMTSTGNPERVKAGQELLTSAISGLILLIFSVFILKFIGIDILGLGAFGFGPN